MKTSTLPYKKIILPAPEINAIPTSPFSQLSKVKSPHLPKIDLRPIKAYRYANLFTSFPLLALKQIQQSKSLAGCSRSY